MGVKGPTKVVSCGGRYTLEDDGETPDLQQCIYTFPNFLMMVEVREVNAFRDTNGSVVMGNKGNLILGTNEVVPEMHGDAVNVIPRFMGHPVGGPVYTDTKAVPWIEARPGSGGRGGPGGGRGPGGGGARAAGGGGGGAAAGGESLEDQMFNANKRDWIDCIKSRNKPFCDLEGGHRTAIICNLGNMSLRLGGRTDPLGSRQGSGRRR